MTEIPEPASPLPWHPDIDEADGCSEWTGKVFPGDESPGSFFMAFLEPSDPDFKYMFWAANNALKLYEMLSWVCEYLDTGDHIDANSNAHMDIWALLKAARGEK